MDRQFKPGGVIVLHFSPSFSGHDFLIRTSKCKYVIKHTHTPNQDYELQKVGYFLSPAGPLPFSINHLSINCLTFSLWSRTVKIRLLTSPVPLTLHT